MSNPEHHYYVYIVASRTHILYIGITDNIERRVEQHRNAEIQGFTATYHCNRLVFWEPYQYVQKAIAREKQLKRWRRSKKIWLIELAKPYLGRLKRCVDQTAGPSTTLRSGRDDKGEVIASMGRVAAGHGR
jgi:putative endonuclease